MANDLYVANDGTIHRHPVEEDNTGINTDEYAPELGVNTQERTACRSVPRVREERKECFWMVSLTISILISLAITKGFGEAVYGDDGGFASTVGPFIVFIGAFAGNILYGIFGAESVGYNLWACILSALSSVGGIIATGIIVVIVCFVAVILFKILIIVAIVALLIGIVGGA